MKKVQIITASSGKNLEIAQSIVERLKLKSVSGEILDLTSLNLPLYISGGELGSQHKNTICDLVNKFKDTHHFFFLAPEYNGGIPPVLTNLISWISVTTKDWREAFNGKHAAIGTYSGGTGANVIAAMRLQMAYIGFNTVGRAISANDSNPLNISSLDAVLEQLIK